MASREEITVCEDEVRSRYSHLEKMTDLVAVWEVALSDGVHKIEFEHGTTSGKRVVYVDGKEEIRKEWMFKLVGKETFPVGAAKTRATINIDAVSGFAYEYTLEINGKSLKKYMENRSKITSTWVLSLGGMDYRVVLELPWQDSSPGEACCRSVTCDVIKPAVCVHLLSRKGHYGCVVQWPKNGNSG
ncbi:fas apoptotic inhibitory molecule 1 isoform X2 [Calonectris borealis]|uniref:fas apoptotic inhibitory molecule 1 isoform X2 n=1 Tax=Calonectris borealis TaxID=1323832 RepID=UPI003F4C0B8F